VEAAAVWFRGVTGLLWRKTEAFTNNIDELANGELLGHQVPTWYKQQNDETCFQERCNGKAI